MAKGKPPEKRHVGQNHGQGGQKGSGRRSFKDIGPRLSKGSYVGHLDKLKQRLIHKAKVKKAYHRELRKDQQSSGQHQDDDPEDDRMDGAETESEKTSVSEEADNTIDVESPQRANLESRMASVMDTDEADSPSSRKRKASEELEEVLDAQQQAQPVASTSQSPNDLFVHPSRRKGALRSQQHNKRGPASVSNPSKPSKKDKAKPEHKKARRTAEEVEQLRERRSTDRKAWAKKTHSGQPNLNSRMEVLLGKIERGSGR